MIGALKDKSTNINNASSQVLAPNGGRVYLLIVNTHATVDVWISLTGGTATPNTAGSIRLAANGGYYEQYSGGYCPTGAIQARAASAVVIGLTIYEG